MTPDQIRADDDDSDRVRSTFDRADNTARLALELAEAKREIARLRDCLNGQKEFAKQGPFSPERSIGRHANLLFARVEAAEAEIARLHRDAWAEAQAYRAMFARAQEAEAALLRVRALADAFADDGLARYGGNIAWHIEETIANEKGDFPDAADQRITSQRERADAAEAKLAAVEALRARYGERAENGCPVRLNYARAHRDLTTALGIEP